MKEIIFLLLALFSYVSYAQTGLTSYSNPPGLQIAFIAVNNGNFLDCDPQGNAWVAFQNKGIGKFDGTNWTVFDTSNSSLRINSMWSLYHDHQNFIWLATDSGLGRFDGVSSWMWYDSTNSILGTNRIFNVCALGNKVLLRARYLTGPVFFKYFSFDVTTGIFQQIDITPLVPLSQQGNYKTLCISPQGNFYIGAPSLKKIVKVDANGNQTLLDLTGLDSTFLGFDVDNAENVWLSNWVFMDTSMTFQTVQHCSVAPEILFSVSPGFAYVRRSYQDIPWFIIGGMSLTFANANPGQNYVFPPNTILYPGFRSIITAPSGESWLTGGGILYKFNPALYSYTPSTPPPDNFLDINDVVARITPICDMHWDAANSLGPQYAVPKCTGVNSVFASAMWIGGLDANDTLHIAAQTYRQDGLDFWPGPLDTLSASIDSATSAAYNRVWKINRSDIVNFVYQYQLGNVNNMTYPVPPDFLSWPAHGTGNFSRALAPFVDNNNDGIYNPYDGDYPKIKGDQMCFSVFNDAFNQHGETGGKPLGFEFHKSSYAASCPNTADSNQVINYTTYYEYEIFNRSDTSYHNMYIGLYSDMDLGHWLDDYVGCDTLLHAAFTYNGDNFDGGPLRYGENPPIQNVTILDGPLANPNDGRDNDNDGVLDEPGEKVLMTHFTDYMKDFTFWGYPSTPIQFYYRMASRWLNGQQLTFGGNGAGSGVGATNIPCNYMYPGTPYDTTQWNEASTGSVPFDKRFLMGCGPFSLPAHGKTKISFAYVWTRDELNPNGINTSIARNRSDLMKIRQWFAADTIPSCLQLYPGVEEHSQLKPLFNLYPNPADESISIQYVSKSQKPDYFIYDMVGRLIKSGRLNENLSVINISALRYGNYIFEISDGDLRTTRSFVKEK